MKIDELNTKLHKIESLKEQFDEINELKKLLESKSMISVSGQTETDAHEISLYPELNFTKKFKRNFIKLCNEEIEYLKLEIEDLLQ